VNVIFFIAVLLSMSHLRTLFVALLCVPFILLASGAGCSMLTGAETDDQQAEYLVADVDSIDAPSQIAPSDTLRVRLVGTVGSDGCHSFERFDVGRSSGRLTLMPIVKHTTGEGIACTEAIVPLNRTYTAPPPFAEGSLTVTVPQPDQPDVTTSVRVTDGQ
jgi:hypothetical protein